MEDCFWSDECKFWVLEKCDGVISANPDTWWALFYSAKVSTISDQSPEHVKQAISRLNIAKSTVKNCDADFCKHYRTEILPLLARCQFWYHDTAGALSSYSEMMDGAESIGILNMSLLSSFPPGQIFDFLKSANTKKVPGATHHWLHELIAGIDTSDDFTSVILAAHYGNDWKCISDTIEAVLEQLQVDISKVEEERETASEASNQEKGQLMKAILARILWYESDKAEDHERALDIWEELEARQIMLRVLIKRRSKADGRQNPFHLDDDVGSRLFDVINTVWIEYQENSSDEYIRTHFIAARFCMDLGFQEDAKRLISKILDNNDYTEDPGSDEQLEQYGKACFVLGEDHFGHDLFAQMTEHDFEEHMGCAQICGTTPLGKGLKKYFCRDCVSFLKPQCFNALNNGVWTAGFCDPTHRHIGLPTPIFRGARDEDAAIDLVKRVGIEHGWLQQQDSVLEVPRTRTSCRSIDEVTTGPTE